MTVTIIGAIFDIPVMLYAACLYTERGDAKPNDDGFCYREQAVL